MKSFHHSFRRFNSFLHSSKRHFSNQLHANALKLDGFKEPIPFAWLRDHCQSSESRSEQTGQRLFDTAMMDPFIEPIDVKINKDFVELTWDENNKQHKSIFSYDWLKYWWNDVPKLELLKEKKRKLNFSHPFSLPKQNLWTSFDGELPTLNYNEICENDQGMQKWLEQSLIHGFTLIKGVPHSKEETFKLIEQIGYTQTTMFGGTWSFEADLSRSDLAYTNNHLYVHTDGTYMSEAAGFQFLHCTHFEGPKAALNTLVDGFAAVQQLDSDSTDFLSRVLLEGRYIDNDYDFINTDCPLIYDINDDLLQLRYNNEDRHVLRLNAENTQLFYEAWHKLSSLIRAQKAELSFVLEPGSLLCFDNWRLLHGRGAFEGHRSMCGAYMSRQCVISKFHKLNGER